MSKTPEQMNEMSQKITESAAEFTPDAEIDRQGGAGELTRIGANAPAPPPAHPHLAV